MPLFKLQQQQRHPLTNLISYESYYKAYNTSSEDFDTFMKSFYEKEVSTNGYFNPSQDFSAFSTSLIAANSTALGSNSSVSGTNSSKALILNQIILLLIEIIGTLQNIGIAQAQQLNLPNSISKCLYCLTSANYSISG